MKRWFIAMVLAWPGLALAQPVFFDDFEGDDLAPHWNRPPPEDWEYNVSGSMLNVTGLFNPSSSKTPNNFARINTIIDEVDQFRATARMGFDPGFGQGVRLELETVGGGTLATFGYFTDSNGVPGLSAFTSRHPGLFFPGPPPGIYDFTIERTSDLYRFSLDGDLLGTLPISLTNPLTRVILDFRGPFPGMLGPLHVDSVLVVPAPGVGAMAVGLLLLNTRRRSRCQPCGETC